MVFPVVIMDVRAGLWGKLSAEELMLLNRGVGVGKIEGGRRGQQRMRWLGGITNSRSPPKPMSIWVSDVIHSSHALLSPSPLAFNLSQHQGLFTWVRWPKYWSFSFNINPSDEYSALISFRIDWFGLLAVQGILKSLQHHRSRASILWCSVSFII